jgi:hypothetical protein
MASIMGVATGNVFTFIHVFVLCSHRGVLVHA